MNSNNKIVKDRIKKHIMQYYDNVEHLRNDVNAVKGYGGVHTNWQAGIKLVEGGSFLIATEDMKQFLNSLGINPSNKKYSNDKIFQTYASLIGREVQNILKRKR